MTKLKTEKHKAKHIFKATCIFICRYKTLFMMNDIGNKVSLAETGLYKDKKTHRPYVSYGNISFPLLGILEHSKKKKKMNVTRLHLIGLSGT